MKYFSNLKYGWADLTIGEFTCRCNYIQDVPMVILNAYAEFKERGYCVITIDSEGYENEIIITELGIHILTYKDKIYYYNLNNQLDQNVLLNDLFTDIVDNIDEWADWMMCLTDMHDKDFCEQIIKNYKKHVLKYAKTIK